MKPIIKIEVRNEETDELIGWRETYSVETAEQILADISQWIKNYKQKYEQKERI